MELLPKRIALPAALLAFALIGAGVAYALTSSDFEPRATAWQSSTCDEALLKSKSSAANNQKIAICYALAKVQEHDGSIASLQSAVAALQANQMPRSTAFTFLNEKLLQPTAVSPVFDARGYTHATFSTQCPREAVTFGLEYSADGTTWLKQEVLYCEEQRHYELAGRYYRVAARRSEAREPGECEYEYRYPGERICVRVIPGPLRFPEPDQTVIAEFTN